MNKTWSSQSATTSLRISASARKRAQVGSSSAATQVINEPKPDWVFPSLAPFYCFSGDYIRSATAWADALQAKVQDVTHTSLWADALEAEARRILKRQESCHAERSSLFAEWSLDRAPEAPGAWITSMGVQTSITPGSILVMPVSPGDGLIDFVKSIDRWAVVGASKAMLSYREWDEGTFGHKFSSPEEKLAAQCHRHC